MKVYISGKITGLPYTEAKAKFQDAQNLLEMIDVEAVNPTKNGLKVEQAWEKHLVRDIELLLGCDAIFMMSNWVESVGARCEYHIARETGKIILFEDSKKEILPFTKLVGEDKHKAWRVYMAMLDVVNLRLHQFIGKTRTTTEFFARLILIWNLHHLDVDVRVIAEFINRSQGAVYHCIKKYDDEYKFNLKFRQIADKVTSKLKTIL